MTQPIKNTARILTVTAALWGAFALTGCQPSASENTGPEAPAEAGQAPDAPAEPEAPGMEAPAAKTADAKPYPLEVCIVSGEELGSMGEPIVLVHEGQTVKFCCDQCAPKFEKEPAKYLAKLAGK